MDPNSASNNTNTNPPASPPLENQNVQVQNEDMSKKKNNFFSNDNLPKLAIPVLIVIILALGSGILFFDDIKSALIKRPPVAQNRQEAQPSAVKTSENEPSIVCRRYKDISEALGNIEIACSIDLSGQDLASIPEDILKLTKLSEIILSNNQFKEFPKILTQIPTLIEIDLSNNQVSTVPESITKLKSLQKLNISNNKISSLPDMTSMESVNYLILRGNSMSQAEIERIKSMFPAERNVIVEAN